MMNKTHLFGLMLAATVALAGCSTPAATMAPGQASGSMSTPAKQQAAAQTSQNTAQAMSEDQEAQNYDYLAENAESGSAMYAVQALGGPKAKDGEVAITADATATADTDTKAGGKPADKGTAKATFKGQLKADVKAKLDERHAKLKAKAKAQLDKMKAEHDAVGKAVKNAKWVDNGDGTESKSFEMSVDKNGNTRSVKMVRTRKVDDKSLVSTHYEMSASQNGMSRSVLRDKALQEDGSYKVTFHSEMTFKDGTKRVVDWTRVVAADGSVTGTGTIVWSGTVNKAVNMTFGGTDEAETAKVTDDATKTETVVTATAEGTASATSKDTETGATADVSVQATP